MSDDRDDTIDRIAEALRPLPEVDPAARARVLVAVAAERERARERAQMERRGSRWIAGGTVAAAAVLLAVAIIRLREPEVRATTDSTRVAPAAGAHASAVLATHTSAPASMRAVQFVFRAPGAHRVSVVGDFTGWTPAAGAMQRDSASGLWSTTLTLPVGRHVYAYLIDDTLWVRDPRLPPAPDADFGRPGSVLLVGTQP